jgi:hypothetical protein
MKDNWRAVRRCWTAALIGSACAAIAPPMADAQTAAPPAPAKSTKPKPKPMSRDELRACMDQQDRVVALRDQLVKQQAALDQQRGEVARIDADLERKRTALDPANAEAAKTLADEEAKRNEFADSFNARLPAVRELNDNYNRERQTWVDRCADKDYDAIDEAVIKRDRQRAAKGAAATK